MSIASQEMSGMPAEKWPFGYFFLLEKTHMGQNRRPALKGELMLRKGSEQATINFQIRELRPNKHSYSLFLFKDEDLREPISFSVVSYPDDNGMHLEHQTALVDPESKGYVHDVIVRAMHVLIFDHIISELEPFKKEPRKAFWGVPLEQDEIDDIEERSPRDLLEIITDIRILLRH